MYEINETALFMISGGNNAWFTGLEYALATGAFAALLAKPFGIVGIVGFGSLGALAGFSYGFY